MTQKKVSDLLQSQNEEGWFERNVVSNAPLIMAVFANLMVIIADVRAFDVVYGLTLSWWKALSASAACAIPFLIWEIAWQYNSTTENWRKVSLVMAGIAFATSIFLGVADFLGFQGTWADFLLGSVVILTGLHTVVGMLYFYNDPDVARRRHKKQAMSKMLDQELNAQVATQLLESGNDLLSVISSLESKYGVDEVENIIRILRGDKQAKPTERVQKRQPPQQFTARPAGAFPQDTEQAKLADRDVNHPS